MSSSTDTGVEGSSPPAPSAPAGLTTEQRKHRLARVVQGLIGLGGRVESTTDYQALISVGGQGVTRGMHIVHGVLTFMTLGIWSIVWLIHTLKARPRRRLLLVDEGGRITGSEWKPGKEGTSPPTIGAITSSEGYVRIEAGKRSVSLDPGINTTTLTKVVTSLVSDPGGGVRISWIMIEPNIRIVTIHMSGKAELPADIYWFALS